MSCKKIRTKVSSDFAHIWWKNPNSCLWLSLTIFHRWSLQISNKYQHKEKGCPVLSVSTVYFYDFCWRQNHCRNVTTLVTWERVCRLTVTGGLTSKVFPNCQLSCNSCRRAENLHLHFFLFDHYYTDRRFRDGKQVTRVFLSGSAADPCSKRDFFGVRYQTDLISGCLRRIILRIFSSSSSLKPSSEFEIKTS